MNISGLKESICIQINNRPIKVHLSYEIEEDDIFDSDDAFKPSADCFCAHIIVRAQAHDLVGADSLGGCDIHCNNVFDSKAFESDVKNIIDSHGMVQIAINDLKSQLSSEYRRLLTAGEKYKVFSKQN